MDTMWFWANDELQWVPFEDHQCSFLKSAILVGPTCNLRISGVDYSFCFQSMSQLNSASGHVRQICRGWPPGPPRGTPIAHHHPGHFHPGHLHPGEAGFGDDEDDEEVEGGDDDDNDDDEVDEDEYDEDDYDEDNEDVEPFVEEGGNEEEDAAAPQHLICPLTQTLLVDPVSTMAGMTYSRSAIARWLREHDTDPLTNMTMTSRKLIPNFTVRVALTEWRETFKAKSSAGAGSGESASAAANKSSISTDTSTNTSTSASIAVPSSTGSIGSTRASRGGREEGSISNAAKMTTSDGGEDSAGTPSSASKVGSRSNACPQCTFENEADAMSCSMCTSPLQVNDASGKRDDDVFGAADDGANEVIVVGDDSESQAGGAQCGVCTFASEDLDSSNCEMCGSMLQSWRHNNLDISTTGVEPKGTGGGGGGVGGGDSGLLCASIQVLPLDSIAADVAAATTGPQASEVRPIVLVLVGLAGSGKSTFAASLLEQSSSPSTSAHLGPSWEVVSQDALGSRQKCEKAVADALAQGRSVVVDRTNLSASQRSTWVDLGASFGAACHAVHITVPVDVCKARVQARKTHPTGVSGTSGLRVLAIMMQLGIQAPLGSEGFTVVAEARNDSSLQTLISLYSRKSMKEDKLLIDEICGGERSSSSSSSLGGGERGELQEGDEVDVGRPGSSDTYRIRLLKGVYSCTCPAWRFAGGMPEIENHFICSV